MKSVLLKNGCEIPSIGQGTWKIGDDPADQKKEIAALRTGIEHGMTLIDTAEMYGNGKSELVVGEAIRPYDREKLFIVSKVLPENAGGNRMQQSCEASLKRLGTDYLDLYLYHWIGEYPLAETVMCLHDLKEMGLIREWGVSNFTTSDMRELGAAKNGDECLCVQNLYHLGSRGAEYSLKPYLRENGMFFMAYCPLAVNGTLRTGMMQSPALKQIAENHNATVQQIMLAWAVRDGNTVAIPKSSSEKHTLENALAAQIQLTQDELKLLDGAFPAPGRELPLDML